MNVNYPPERGSRLRSRSLLAALAMIVVAAIAVLGLSSTRALAADNVTSITPDSAKETVLVSDQTGPVPQDITQADYDKLNPQYNVAPDSDRKIISKTVNEENLQTKTEDDHDKS